MPDSDLSLRVRARIGQLPPAIIRVAQFMANNPVNVLASSAAELGNLVSTSDATVVRTAKALGYSGLAELKRVMAQELSAGTPARDYELTLSATDRNAVAAMRASLRSTCEIVSSLEEPANMQRAEKMVLALDSAQRIVLYGIGPSARVAEHAAFQMRRQGRSVLALGTTGRNLADDLLDFGKGDVLLLICYDTPYPEVFAVVREALSQSVAILLMTNREDNPIVKHADEHIVLPRGGELGMALNGPTFVCLETITLGLSVLGGVNTQRSLKRLEALRARIDDTARHYEG
ncbi:MAG: MurR/RpiR family transcriptional regulator [Rhodocyclaceae bacterium]